MKNIFKISIFITAIALSSCGDELTDLNENPSFPSDVAAITLVPNIQQEMARGVQFDSRFVGKYVQYFSESTAGNVWDLQGYALAPSDAGGEIWRTIYFGHGLNLSVLLKKAEEEKRYDILGFGKLMRAWGWQTGTDYHGELINFDQVFTPRLTFDYSSQERAYAEVVKLADEGIASLNRTDGFVNQAFFAKGDAMYKGDRSKWIKFAYGLKARNLNSQINKSTYDPVKIIQFCDLSLASPADDAVINFAGTITADANFFGPLRNNMTNFRQTDFLIRAMSGNATTGVFPGAVDPRISRITVPSSADLITAPVTNIVTNNPSTTTYIYNGNPLNTTAATSGANRIPNFWGTFTVGNPEMPGRYIFRNKAEFPVMTFTEIQFIKAEAAFKLGNLPLALDAYKKGIEASFDLVNRNTVESTSFPINNVITTAERTAFMNNTAIVPANAGDLTLSQIMMQKYIALFGFGTMETWVDMRKYRYDPLVYKSFSVTSFLSDNELKMPYRVRPRYASEYIWNLQAIQSIGADKRNYHTKEMWFMQP